MRGQTLSMSHVASHAALPMFPRMGECCRKPLAAVTNTVISGFSTPHWTSEYTHLFNASFQLGEHLSFSGRRQPSPVQFRSWPRFSGTVQIVNILGFAGSCCHHPTFLLQQEGHDGQYINKQMQLCSNTSLFARTSATLQFAASWHSQSHIWQTDFF